jgi:hypothetical protein
MMRDTLVDVLVQRLNNRTDLRDAIITEMQIAQTFRLEQHGRFQPWFLITELATEITEINEQRVPEPNDFIIEVEEQALWVQNTAGKWKKLTKGAEDDLQLKWGDAEGLPQNYAFVGSVFIMYPIPDAMYPLRMRYAAAQGSLATNIENGWTKYAGDLLIAEVGAAIAAQTMQNPTLAPAWDRLQTLHEARQHTNRSYTMGEEE